jgi:hypothetical protein
VSNFLIPLQINNKTVIHKELKVKDYKSVLKCLVNDPLDLNFLILNLNFILKKVTNLSEQEINQLNIIEYFLLLLNIRMFSLGSSIFTVYKKEELNIEISLQPLLDTIISFLNEDHTTTIKKENYTFKFSIPSVEQLITNDELSFVTIVNKDILPGDLPISYIKFINKHIKQIKNKINKIFFYKSPIDKYSIKFSSDRVEYFSLIKLLFNENLLTIYDNILYLSKVCNISSNYLENCTYGEFKIFVKKTEEMLYQLKNKTTDNTLVNNLDNENEYEPVDINSLYGNDPSPQVTKSEFTP